MSNRNHGLERPDGLPFTFEGMPETDAQAYEVFNGDPDANIAMAIYDKFRMLGRPVLHALLSTLEGMACDPLPKGRLRRMK